MRLLPIRRSLHRHSLVMGGERELVMLSALLAMLVGVGGMSWSSSIVAVAFWLVALFVLRRMAKADPCMSKVWMTHVKQQDFYPARSKPWRKV